MAKRAEATSPPDNVHTRTLAKHTTTPEVATARPAPSVSQVLAAQRADQTIDRAGNIRRTDLAEGSPAAPLPTAPDTPAAPATSKTALEQHLAELAGTGGRYLQPDGSKGIHRTTDDDVEMPMPATFLCPPAGGALGAHHVSQRWQPAQAVHGGNCRGDQISHPGVTRRQ